MRPDVWAPRAAAVDVVFVDGSTAPLSRRHDGWHVGGPELAPGEEYRFSLDGGEPLPDPRSHSQPDGIDGASVAVDHAAFPWTDAGWKGFHLPGSVLYELHVGTFTDEGDLDGAIARLDHLVDLGVDAVEVMPVAEAMGERGWGYDSVLLYAVHHAYGGPGGLKRFVDACHHRGLGVVLDVVYNHLGPKGNHLERFGPYFTDAHHTPWGAAVNLDGEGCEEVRRFVVDNARHWFEHYHVDGLRLDATHALLDDSPTHLLAELSESVEQLAAHLGRPLWLVAEDERDDPRITAAREAGGWGVDARWADGLHHALHVALTGETSGYYSRFASEVGAVPALLTSGEQPAHRAVTCAQNHDQVGNRATGDRLAHLVGPAGQMVAAAVVLCSPGTPLLFMGEEWAASSPFPYFVDVPGDEALAAAIRDGRRGEFADFGWAPDEIPDPTDPATFASAVLDWSEVDGPPHREVLGFYKRLLALRKERADLTDGRRALTSVHADVGAGVLVVRRRRTAVAANTGEGPAVVPAAWLAPAHGAAGPRPVLVATDPTLEASSPFDPDGSLRLPGRTAVVVALDG